jgi:hypothetical protein
MEKFKEELNWTPKQCRKRLYKLLVIMKRTREEKAEIVAIRDYLRSMGKD